MTDSERLEVVCEMLAARGYALDRQDRRVVATPTDGAETVGVPGPLEVVPARTAPTHVMEAVGSAAAAGRIALFVAHPVDAPTVRDVLTDPPGLAGADDEGAERQFYSVPDRLHAGDAGLACCRAATEPTWYERPANGVTGEGSRLVLEADGDPVAAFESVADLSCPGRLAFRYAYRRDDDGRFRVRKLGTDRTVGRFTSVGEMKANAYRPVPVPLVPERVVETYLPEAWALATVDGGRLQRVESA